MGEPIRPIAPRIITASRVAQPRTHAPADLPYVRWGIGAGALGAFVVAMFFLVLDLLAGRPFGTPSDLGAALFLGRPFSVESDPNALLVLGYTFVHGSIFVGLAMTASSLALGAKRGSLSPAALAALLTVVFFVGLALLGSGFWLLTDASIWNALGPGRVAVANLLASLAMAGTLACAFHWHVRRSRASD